MNFSKLIEKCGRAFKLSPCILSENTHSMNVMIEILKDLNLNENQDIKIKHLQDIYGEDYWLMLKEKEHGLCSFSGMNINDKYQVSFKQAEEWLKNLNYWMYKNKVSIRVKNGQMEWMTPLDQQTVISDLNKIMNDFENNNGVTSLTNEEMWLRVKGNGQHLQKSEVSELNQRIKSSEFSGSSNEFESFNLNKMRLNIEARKEVASSVDQRKKTNRINDFKR